MTQTTVPHTTSPATPQRRNARGQAARIVGEVLLWCAATLGVLCVLLAVLGAAFGFRVLLFSSGSMAPAIPVGSAALAHQVDAADVRLGDIVTVDRGSGQFPVTHRVVGINAVEAPDARLLTLRGDANAEPDPLPHEVTSVDRVVFAVPGTAPVVSLLGNPRLLAPLGVLAAVLVIWGLWPRRAEAGP